jgi:SAM-dependent methyltransferase
MVLYAVTISLSAFLLFEVQPIIARMILPWFGGSSAVWSTCMLFFQVVLLLGYLYAHWLHHKLRPRLQAAVHGALLAASLAALPILPSPSWAAPGAGQPSLRILALLALTVGLPYFLLSSTSPLLQAWYAGRHRDGLPYRLFALSNFFSMLALLSYPLLVEPNFSVRRQGISWSWAYAAFALSCGFTAWRSGARLPGAASLPAAAEAGEASAPAPSWSVRALWLGLAASASVLLLALTNHLTQDVAAIPFLWILPLSVYLLSFILCFESPRLYWRPVFLPLALGGLAFMAYRLWNGHARMPLRPLIALLALALFVCSMVCHGELARLKPHPRYLTGFYVLVSLGGAMGGVFVGLIAPNVFHAYYEFPTGLAFSAAVLFLLFARRLWRLAGWRRWAALATPAAALACYAWFLGVIMHDMAHGYRVVARNFYGQLRVYDNGDPADDPDSVRELVHGTINHGEQPMRPEFRRQPITYFCPDSGIGRAMRSLEGAPRRIGILGLGCGTLAAYGRAGDTLRIYEINPLVLKIARNQFTYLADTAAAVEVAMGDGRLSLEREPAQHFDLLVMDAFSGDSVPVHLITREAFRTYFRHLKPGGILAVNITNAYLDLEPVIERAASDFGKVSFVYRYDPPEEDDVFCFHCAWTLIMAPGAVDAHPELARNAKRLAPHPRFREWTDDFSNMFGILK